MLLLSTLASTRWVLATDIDRRIEERKQVQQLSGGAPPRCPFTRRFGALVSTPPALVAAVAAVHVTEAVYFAAEVCTHTHAGVCVCVSLCVCWMYIYMCVCVFVGSALPRAQQERWVSVDRSKAVYARPSFQPLSLHIAGDCIFARQRRQRALLHGGAEDGDVVCGAARGGAARALVLCKAHGAQARRARRRRLRLCIGVRRQRPRRRGSTSGSRTVAGGGGGCGRAATCGSADGRRKQRHATAGAEEAGLSEVRRDKGR